MRLKREFFQRPTLKVAKDLLGKFLIRRWRDKFLIGRIVETEAYVGPIDRASHAYSPRGQSLKEKLNILEKNWPRIKNYVSSQNKFVKNILAGETKVTDRNLAEYLRGGHIYIYLVYGLHYQLNITTARTGRPECVLIRALEPILNLSQTNGPGKLCRELRLNRFFWAEDLTASKRIWLTRILPGKIKSTQAKNYLQSQKKGNGLLKTFVRRNDIVRAKRIGIDYAGEDRNLLWRFYLKDNQFVSRK